MGRREHLTIRATHHFVTDPEMEATLDVWVKLLVEALRKRSPESGVVLPPVPDAPSRPML